MKIQVNKKTFIKFVSPMQRDMAVETRELSESIELPEECEFYFYDSYVGTVDGVEYPFGPEMNVSRHYFKVSEHYVNPDYFRVYSMRCYGWSEEKIWDPTGKSYKRSMFTDYTVDKYPQGVVIVNQLITNPGKDGIILFSKKTINEYIYPSTEEMEAYK